MKKFPLMKVFDPYFPVGLVGRSLNGWVGCGLLGWTGRFNQTGRFNKRKNSVELGLGLSLENSKNNVLCIM